VTALSLEKVNAGQASHRMSLLIDVEMGRPIEAEVRLANLGTVTLTAQVIVGAVVRIAKKHKIPVPLLEYTYALLKALQGHLAHQQELKRKA
jgi:2-dehydropantoate 2-reductase